MSAWQAESVDVAFVMCFEYPCLLRQLSPGRQKLAPLLCLSRLQSNIFCHMAAQANMEELFKTYCTNLPGCCMLPEVDAPAYKQKQRQQCLLAFSAQFARFSCMHLLPLQPVCNARQLCSPVPNRSARKWWHCACLKQLVAEIFFLPH